MKLASGVVVNSNGLWMNDQRSTLCSQFLCITAFSLCLSTAPFECKCTESVCICVQQVCQWAKHKSDEVCSLTHFVYLFRSLWIRDGFISIWPQKEQSVKTNTHSQWVNRTYCIGRMWRKPKKEHSFLF